MRWRKFRAFEAMSAFRKVPDLWDDHGRVKQWRASKGQPYARSSNNGKIPLHFTEAYGGWVFLWAYTMPRKPIDSVPYDELSPTRREQILNKSVATDGFFDQVPRHLGIENLAEFAPATILWAVDNYQMIQAGALEETDAWGNPPQPVTCSKARALQIAAELKKSTEALLGEWLLERLMKRKAKKDMGELIQLVRFVSEWRHVAFDGWFTPAMRVTEDFPSTVYRCGTILKKFAAHAIPTKKALRDYVRQEWCEMGGQDSTVDSRQFSDALREFGWTQWPKAKAEGVLRVGSNTKKRKRR
jgi:hypothetical protein